MFSLSERERAEMSLRETEQHNHALIEAAPDVIFTISPRASFTSLNPAFEVMTGWSREKWLHRPLHHLVHPEDLSIALDMLARALSAEQAPAFELRVQASSGQYLSGEFTLTPLMDEGEVISVLGIGRDVTPRKRTEQELKARGRILEAVAFAAEQFLVGSAGSEAIQEVLKRLAEAANVDRVAVFQNTQGEDGDVLVSELHSWTDPEVPAPTALSSERQCLSYRGMGYDRWIEVLGGGGVISGHIRDFPPVERDTLEREGFLSIAIVPIFIGGEWWGSISYGQVRAERDWSNAEIRVLKTAAGLFGASIHQARSDEALRESEDRYRRLVELSPDAIAVHSESVFVFANRAMIKLLGLSAPDDLVGRPIFDVVHPDYHAQVKALRSGEPPKDSDAPLVEEQFVRRDGTVIDVEVAGIPVTYQDRPAWQIVIRDITDRKRAEASLRQRNEYLAALHETSLAIMDRLDLRESLEAIAARAAALLGTEHAFVYVVDPEHDEIVVEVALGALVGWAGFRMKRGEGIGGKVWESGEPLVVQDYDTWEGRSPSFHKGIFRAAMGVPLKSALGVVGVLGLAHIEEGRAFGDSEVELLVQFAALASIALDNARLYTQLQRELSERGRFEIELVQTEAKYRTLVERIPAITYTAEFGEDGPWLYVSPQIESILGFTPEEWMAAPDLWYRQLHPDDAPQIIEMEQRSRRTMEPMQCEYRLFARDGRVVWVRDDWVIARQESGELLLQGVIFDITERKAAEGQLREAEIKYRTLVEQIPAISYVDVYDPTYTPDKFRTAYVSPQIEMMLGYSPEEFIANPELWYSLVHPGDRERALAADDQHYRTGAPLTEEYRVIGRDGRTVWVLDEAVVVRDEQGQPRFSQGILYDITSRKKAEEDLERALSIEREAAERLRALDELKTTFLHAVSHELRTPLSAVLGLALTLEREEEVQLPREERQDLVRRLAANARKLDQLLSDLLDLDRLDRGILEPRRRPTDVAALVRRTVENSDILGTRPVRVAAQLVVVSVDAPKVERIVENLLANAARHTPPDTEIWVRVLPQLGGVLICVEDDGPGVSEKLRESIFEPFRQGPDAPSHSPGVGIGLSLVAKFAELHGGRAWVEDRPGGGASFRVFLPGAAA